MALTHDMQQHARAVSTPLIVLMPTAGHTGTAGAVEPQMVAIVYRRHPVSGCRRHAAPTKHTTTLLLNYERPITGAPLLSPADGS